MIYDLLLGDFLNVFHLKTPLKINEMYIFDKVKAVMNECTIRQ